MPVGASKLGVLGAGLVPGGSVTFNAPGTWAVPPGVKTVSITGRGGTGNPGTAGNPGNPGNPGTGGGGGGGGTGFQQGPGAVAPPGFGGYALRTFFGGNQTSVPSCSIPFPSFFNNYVNKSLPAPIEPQISYGGYQGCANPAGQPNQPSSVRRNGCGGISGNAGTAGNGGNAGNPGQPSSGLGNTFPGGAGGNAPPGGAAGNAGSAGQGGTSGNLRGNTAGGAGGNGAGSGGTGIALDPGVGAITNIGGGGGAGTTNSGTSGQSAQFIPFPNLNCPVQITGPARSALGGTDACVSAPRPPSPRFNNQSTPAPPVPTNIMGGPGGAGAPPGLCRDGLTAVGFSVFTTSPNTTPRMPISCFNPAPLRPNVLRSGGGGGGTGSATPTSGVIHQYGGGGGGGGRGNAGNAGGTSPTVSGSAGTPQTFNGVPVTPGTPTPITVGTPGGQIVISWNPQ